MARASRLRESVAFHSQSVRSGTSSPGAYHVGEYGRSRWQSGGFWHFLRVVVVESVVDNFEVKLFRHPPTSTWFAGIQAQDSWWRLRPQTASGTVHRRGAPKWGRARGRDTACMKV